MSYKEKLNELVKDLNLIINDKMLFPGRRNMKGFVISEIKNHDGLKVFISYEDCEIQHWFLIKTCKYYNKDLSDFIESDFYKNVYFEFLRMGLLGIDSIGQIKDSSTGVIINILNFRTLISEGLEKLR